MRTLKLFSTIPIQFFEYKFITQQVKLILNL